MISKGDQRREKALEWKDLVEETLVPLVTTEFCLLEVVDFVSARGYRSVARDLVATLRSGELVTIVPCSTELMARGMALHQARDDKAWSLTDCTSFVVMRELGISDALTFDSDFIQAGMRALTLE